MGRRVRNARGSSKPQLTAKGPKQGRKGRSIHPALVAFRGLFPLKTPENLRALTGASISFCKKVLDGRLQPGGPMLEALIFSDVGVPVLKAMAAARPTRPAWWSGFRRHLDLADAVKAQKAATALIEKLQREIAE